MEKVFLYYRIIESNIERVKRRCVKKKSFKIDLSHYTKMMTCFLDGFRIERKRDND